MAQAAVYFLLLISVLPLFQASHCPTRHYCPVGLDCSKDKDLCQPLTCSESANGSMLCKKGIFVSFTQASYDVSEGAGLVQPVLMLSEALNCCNFHVRIDVRDITAKYNLDYKYTSLKSGQMTVIIPAGQTRVSFDITILDDIIIEEDIESFQLSIIEVSLPHNVSVGNIPSATVNIIDDDYACVDFERTTYSIRENDRSGSVPVNVILSRPTAIDIPITISTVDIDTDECDYDHGPYRAVFKNENRRSGTQRASFRVNIFDDDIYEENERFNLYIDTPLHNRISRCNPYRSTVTISNDESLISMYFDKTSITVDEDVGSISPVLKLDKPSPCCVTVLVELIERTATGRGIDYDYEPPETPMYYEYTFSAGDTCATPDRQIPIVDDKESDENEQFEIHIVDDSVPYGARIRGRDYILVTIMDNDINLCFDESEFIVDENKEQVTITMTIDERPPKDFLLTIRDDPVNAFGYYSPGPYNITIKKNHNIREKVQFTINITAKDPQQQCTGNRIFNLTIECPSSPVGIAPCSDRGMTKVIIMDHESGSISFVSSNYRIKKNQVLPTKPQLRFHGRPEFTAVVNVNDRQVASETGHATGGEDYKVRNYMETFALGRNEESKTVDLTLFPFDDNIVEDDETYYLDIEIDTAGEFLASYPCISVGIRTADITILNDDRVLVKIDKYSLNSVPHEDLVFTRGLKFESTVDIIYEGRSNDTNIVVPEASPFDDHITPTPIPLDPDYKRMIYVTVHPAVFDYVDISDDKTIILQKKQL